MAVGITTIQQVIGVSLPNKSFANFNQGAFPEGEAPFSCGDWILAN
jgi:hypothetical protein